jgi:hypothetical protein
MNARHVIDVDLADFYGSESKEGFVRTLAWGDAGEVVNVNDEHVEIRTTKVETRPDGSIKPVPASGFTVPSASSGIKPAEIVVEQEESRVLKVDFADVQQARSRLDKGGDNAVGKDSAPSVYTGGRKTP